MTKHEEFDACVIGTGAGGGVMIQELTAPGFRVVALQRGPFLKPSDFEDASSAPSFATRSSRPTRSRRGATTTRARPRPDKTVWGDEV
jgi:choline dehydrogenase-like flavoprotein